MTVDIEEGRRLLADAKRKAALYAGMNNGARDPFYDGVVETLTALQARLDAVRALHAPGENMFGTPLTCTKCGSYAPMKCDTLKALEGES